MSYVYFIESKDDGSVKIGTTAGDPRKRMAKIQSDCPSPVRLIGFIEASVSVERQLHLLLSRWKKRGEWFHPHQVVLAAIDEAIRVGMKPSPPAEISHGSKLRTYRMSREMSQTELARLVGVKTATISRLETGTRQPSADLIRRIIKASNGQLTADDLVSEPSA